MLLLSLLPHAMALDEMHTYGVEAFGADPECCDACGVIPWSIDASDKVFDDFSDFIDDSDWDVARSNNNAAVDPEDWIDDDEDPSFGDDNVDPWGADSADVAFIFTHGTSDCFSDGTGDQLSFVMGVFNDEGTYSDMCSPDSNGEWRFGDDSDDLEIVVNDACHGADTCAWDNGAFSLTNTTGLRGTDLRMYLGFHGVGYSSPGTPGEMNAYVTTSLTSGIGSHWLSERVWIGILGNDDQCPVAITFGTTTTDATSFHNSGGFADRFNNTPHAVHRRVFIDDCDPAEGGAM